MVACASAPALATAQGGRSQARCSGQVITDVVVRSEGPTYGTAFERSRALGNLLVRLHTPTSPEVIRNFLLLQKGDRCNGLRRSESERLLRAMPFIADASVTAYQDGAGVRLEVVTVDEPSMVANLGVKSGSPFVSRVTLGNANLMGNAVYASGMWREGGFYRDGYSARYTNYQLFTKPYQLDLRWARRELGSEWTARVSDPFLTEVQRTAWRLSAGQSNDFAPFRRPDTLDAALRVRREYMDAGALTRFGPAGRRGLLGFQFSVEDVDPGSSAVVITDEGVENEDVPALRNRYGAWRSVRLNTLLGFRAIRFRRVEGFDALSGSQDLRTGVQVSSTMGRAMPTSRGIARDETFAGVEAYTGIAGARTYAAVETQLEARHRKDAGWEDILANGRAAAYFKPHPRHLLTMDFSWSSVRESRLPVTLALGDRRGGLRGYADSWLAGGTRVVGRLEERWRVASIRGSANAAVALFTDIGGVRAGDVPLGTSSGVRQSIGTSLILAIPAKSQRMWRVDFAYPLQRGGGSGFEIRLSSEDRTQVFSRVPNDVSSARERVVPQSIFRWP